MNRLIKYIGKSILKNQPHKIIDDHDLEYLLWISNMYLKIKNVPGHIAEIGVAYGRNAILFGKLIKIHNDQSVRQYIGFDTFDGFTKKDLERDTHLNKNRWKKYNKEKVLNRCSDNDVEDLIEIFEGDAIKKVPEILKNHQGKKFQKNKGKFALLYVDCNAYLPAIASMENFLPYMTPGGYIVIDEKTQGSETEAIFNFAKKNSLNIERENNHAPMFIKV